MNLPVKLHSKSPASIRMGKRAFNRQMQLGLHEAYELTSATMADNLLDPDATEGIDAFLSKRKPVWPSVEKQLKGAFTALSSLQQLLQKN